MGRLDHNFERNHKVKEVTHALSLHEMELRSKSTWHRRFSKDENPTMSGSSSASPHSYRIDKKAHNIGKASKLTYVSFDLLVIILRK